MRMTILNKLLLLLILLTVIPLSILGIFATKDARSLGFEAAADARLMGESNLKSAQDIGNLAVEDSKAALTALAKESIEVRAVTTARQIADFLYERDNDILAARNLDRTLDSCNFFLNSKKKDVIYGDLTIPKHIYKEIAFLGVDGNPEFKVTITGYDGKDYVLDDYKSMIPSLVNNQIYVSRVWGDYVVKSKAYAGIENPEGQRYEGYVRWVTPIYLYGKKTGYVSLKLDPRHVMEFTDHLSPTKERFVKLSDAPSGNYAYLVDDEGWLISHAREYHLKGVLPDGTLPPPYDVRPGAIPLLQDSMPLRFGYLSGSSKELDEIHTVHAVNGESGSQIYPWAGLDKWIAYSPIPYYTGANYNDKLGFGWVGLGAQIDKFYEPATETETKILAKTEQQASTIQSMVAATENKIQKSTEGLSTNNTIFLITLATIVLVVIIGYLFASTITKPLKKLTDAGKKLSEGEIDVVIPEIKSNDEIKDLGESLKSALAAVRMLVEDARSKSKANPHKQVKKQKR